MNQLLIGDCRHLLPTFPDNYFDSCILDTPYELGFMGAAWDKTGIAYDVPTWREVLRVLKPGAHLLAFGGSRTYHRITCAIEDAGFEIRDQIMWVYGCLSEDTEVLTENGFMTIDRIRRAKKLRIFAYDKSTDNYVLEQPSAWNEYRVTDTCYRIESAATDQLVSRNHRCLVEREGALVFELAEHLAQERQACVPVLESLSAVRCSVYGAHQRAGGAQPNVRPCVCGRQYRGQEQWPEAGTEAGGGSGLCGVWGGGQQAARVAEKDCPADLRPPVQRQAAKPGVEAARSQRAGCVDPRAGASAETAHDGRSEPGLEGRHHLPAQEGLLCRGTTEVCALPVGISGDGPKGWLRSGISVSGGAAAEALPNAGGSGAPYRPQSDEQRGGEPDALCLQCRTQALRERPSYSTTLAAITPVDYDGVIFCPTVSSGAFVARRNGKIFLTGNSGFPKGLDVSKAIDKAAGAERAVAARSENVRPGGGRGNGLAHGTYGSEWNETSPATPEAEQWTGWGTALKPAHEPICVARKPLEKGLTVAQNVLKWGVGALNIGACRIGTAGGMTKHSNSSEGVGWSGRAATGDVTQNGGRWPANLIHDGSEPILAAFAAFGETTRADKHTHKVQHAPPGTNTFGEFGGTATTPTYADTGTVARFFYCAKASPAERGKGNDHPCVKPQALLCYLARLVTPPGGLILDHFTGSGSGPLAFSEEGFRWVAMDLDPHNIAIAEKRLAAQNQARGLFGYAA